MKSLKYLTLGFVLVLSGQLFAQPKPAPTQIAAALTIKLLAFDKAISGDITIYVLGSSEMAAALKKGLGKKIGAGKLAAVEAGDDLPSSVPSVLYVGHESKLDAAIGYTKEHKVLSVTGFPDLVSKGVTLGFGIGDDKKPKILLNLSSSVDEARDWNPAIMKVAKTFN